MRRMAPHLVVVGDALPGMGPLACLRRIKAELPQVRVVMLVNAADVSGLTDALLAGANGFLETAGLSPAAFLSQLREAYESAYALSRHARELVVQDFLAHHAKPPKPAILTEREYQVAVLMGLRYSNQEISDRLGISVSTIAKHMQRIYEKTGAHNRRDSVAKLWPEGQQTAPGASATKPAR